MCGIGAFQIVNNEVNPATVAKEPSKIEVNLVTVAAVPAPAVFK